MVCIWFVYGNFDVSPNRILRAPQMQEDYETQREADLHSLQETIRERENTIDDMSTQVWRPFLAVVTLTTCSKGNFRDLVLGDDALLYVAYVMII